VLGALVEYAEHEFWLDGADSGSKATRRQHLENREQQTGKTPDSLIGPVFPDAAEGVWGVWQDVIEERQIGMNGPGPLTYAGLDAYQRVVGTRLALWEVQALKALDRVWRQAIS